MTDVNDTSSVPNTVGQAQQSQSASTSSQGSNMLKHIENLEKQKEKLENDLKLEKTVSGKMYKLPDDGTSSYAIHMPVSEVNRTVTIKCGDPRGNDVNRIILKRHKYPGTRIVVFDKLEDIHTTVTLPEESSFYCVYIEWHDGVKNDTSIIPIFLNCSKDQAKYDENVRRTQQLFQSISTLETTSEFETSARWWRKRLFHPYQKERRHR
jgi:hypothetical protein